MTMQTMTDNNQAMLADSVRDYVARGYASAQREASLAHPQGCDPARWREFAELGWLALPLPEADGGLGGGLVDICAVSEQMGRGLVLEPFVACAVLGAGLLAVAADDAVRGHWLPRLAEGQARVASGGGDGYGSGYGGNAVDACGITASPARGGRHMLQGEVQGVAGGAGADAYLLAASVDAETGGVFLVPANAPGLKTTPQRWYDGQVAVDLRLREVEAMALRTGPAAEIRALLDDARQRAMLAHAAETVGLMQGAFDTTLEYLQTRKQFGRSITSNQVVQHRLVDLYVEIAEARALVQAAALVVDAGVGKADASAALRARHRHAAAARATVATTAHHVWESAVQLHGAIGMTQECPLAPYVKRLATACTVHGSAEQHFDALAALALDTAA